MCFTFFLNVFFSFPQGQGWIWFCGAQSLTSWEGPLYKKEYKNLNIKLATEVMIFIWRKEAAIYYKFLKAVKCKTSQDLEKHHIVFIN